MIDVTSESGVDTFRCVIQVPGAWQACTGRTADAALALGRLHARAALTANPRLRAVVISVVALCPRCGGHGQYGVRTGLAVTGGQTRCSRCDGSGCTATVAKEVIGP